MIQIDLNSDLGESYGAWKMGNDDQILSVVSSANIACGFHAGDPQNILKTLKQAAQRNVAVGAHVSYPDLVGFGRRKMDLSYDELFADVLYQISALQGLAEVAGTRIKYVKPHGALYNTIATDLEQAQAVIDAIQQYDANLVLVGLAGSPLIPFARKQGLAVVSEAFADRAYHNNGTLVSRRLDNAVIHDTGLVAQRVLDMVLKGGVESIEGEFTKIQADTICVHGDTMGAVQMAQEIRQTLLAQHIQIRNFVG